jgi:SAM-dependent methyltransferase
LVDVFSAKAFDSQSLFCRALRNIGVGRLVFHIRVLSFKLENLLGRFNQRFIEYPWVLEQLGSGRDRLLLDVGCTESLLDHELLARGFRVVGLDVRDHTQRNKREIFVKANVINTELPSEIFDVIILVSTIEHIGLDTYSQDLLKEEGDYLTMQELRRLLKPNGVLVLTTPFEGKGPLRLHRFGKKGEFLERRYDSTSLAKLLTGFEVVDSTFFLCLLTHGSKFVKIDKSILDKLDAEKAEGSLACLLLRKTESD